MKIKPRDPSTSVCDQSTAITKCDPVTLEVILGALCAAQIEMETLLERTAMSPFIREKKDFWAALYDPNARMVAGTAIPLFGKVIEPILEHYPKQSMRPGDVYWYNDPYGSDGAVSHSPDQVLVAPVFADGELSGFSQTWAHLSDIGGAQPGSLSPKATNIFQEGIMFPPVQLCREGVVNNDLIRIFERNSRLPEMVRGDIRALTASVRVGERRISEIFQRFGREMVLDAFLQLQDRTEAKVKRAFRSIFPNGSYSFADSIDGDGLGNGPFSLRVTMQVDDDAVSVDTAATDDQAPGPVNYLMHPVVPSLMMAVYLTSDEPSALLNDGHMRLFRDVQVRPGSLLQPKFPAPLGQRGLTWIRLQYVFMGLTNIATGGKGVASSSSYVIYYMRGKKPETDESFLLQDGVAVGYGARSFADGIDAVYLVAQENYPAEFLNSIYPVRLRHYGINQDSGGPGRWRGGCGVIREVEVLADEVMMSLRMDGIQCPPWGVAGGMSGRPGRAVVNPGRADERLLKPLDDGILLRRGDIVRLQTGGGGGWGHPFDRPAEDVRNDVIRGYVSKESAETDYGVLLKEGPHFQLEIDDQATQEARQARPPAKLFHRGSYVDLVG